MGYGNIKHHLKKKENCTEIGNVKVDNLMRLKLHLHK